MSYVNLPLLVRGRTIQDKYVFPDEIFEARDKAVKKMASEFGLEGIIVFAGSFLRGLVCYLNYQRNGFSYVNTMWIVPKESGSVMLSTSGDRDIQRAKAALPSFINIVGIGLNLMANDHIGTGTSKYLKDNGLLKGKWGIVNGESIPYTAYQALIADGLQLVDVTAAFEDMKIIKDSNELYPISQASFQAQRMVFDFIRLSKAGVVPIELQARLDRGMRMNGVEHTSFLISRGKETAFTITDDTPIKNGEMISLFYDIQFLHYHGAYGTTFVVGSGTKEQNELINKSKALLDKNIEKISPSMKAQIGYQSVDDFGSYVIVNSIGIDLVDAPMLDGKIYDLKPCMTLNITVSLCDPNVGSAVQSRTAVVTKDGITLLNDFGPLQLSKQYV